MNDVTSAGNIIYLSIIATAFDRMNTNTITKLTSRIQFNQPLNPLRRVNKLCYINDSGCKKSNIS